MEDVEKIMEIRIEIDELKKRKLFVATPMYGGQCHGMYTSCLLYTSDAADE